MLASKLLPEQEEQQNQQLQDLQQQQGLSSGRQQAAYVQVRSAYSFVASLCYRLCMLQIAMMPSLNMGVCCIMPL